MHFLIFTLTPVDSTDTEEELGNWRQEIFQYIPHELRSMGMHFIFKTIGKNYRAKETN